MSNVSQKIVHQYLRHNKKFPNVWCAGCSIGIILGAIIRGIADLQIPKDEIMMVSGIGCSSRMPVRSEEHTSELQSRPHLVCRLLLEKKNNIQINESER